MKTQRRWLKAALTESTKTEVTLPWARGAQRAAFKARRAAAEKRPQARMA